MKPSVIRSLGAVPAAPNTDLGTIIGTATAAAAVVRNARLDEVNFIVREYDLNFRQLPRVAATTFSFRGAATKGTRRV